MKITLNAYIPDWQLPAVSRQDLDTPEKLAPYLSFNQSDMTTMGYVLVGTVELDVELLAPDEIVGNAVIALRAKASAIRAKATAEATKLEGQAQQLLAIENSPKKASHD